MKVRALFLCCIVLSSLYVFGQSQSSYKKNGVISAYEGGRLGDKLWTFANTLFFALKNKCDFYLIPFNYSDHLMMDELLPKYSREIERNYKHKVVFSGGDVFMGNRSETLFVVPFFPDPANFETQKNYRPSFIVDWDDPEFKFELRRLCAPKHCLRLIEPPKDRISVAVHVRKGGSYDRENIIASNPELLIQSGVLIYKIPFDEFYIQQIKKVFELFNNTRLYVFLFTDHQQPEDLVKKYTATIDNPLIEITCRKGEPTDHCYNVLEDFFSMMNFDVLIRSQSCFSWMAEKLGNNKLVISASNTFVPGTWIQESLIDVKDKNLTMSK